MALGYAGATEFPVFSANAMSGKKQLCPALGWHFERNRVIVIFER